MKGPITAPWGKLAGEPGAPDLEWHPLRDHCLDVAACCEALLDTTLLADRLARLGGLRELSPVHKARLSVLAFLHDLGKVNHGFQNKARADRRHTAGHVQEVVALAQTLAGHWQEALGQALGPIIEWAPEDPTPIARLWLASVCHHGRPIGEGATTADNIWKARGGRDPLAEMTKLVSEARRAFPRAWDPEPVPLPTSPSFQHAFSGLVMLADWLGSDRAIFPFAERLDSDRLAFARAAARRHLAAMGLDPGPARAALGPAVPAFHKVFRFTPRAAQRVLGDLTLAHGAPMTVLLEAETGAGKTEAALYHYLRAFHAGLVDGLYFALPTRTAATQIHSRLDQALAKTFPDEATRPPLVLAVPGYLRVDDKEGVRLPGFEVLWNDVEAERFRARAWAAENAKRYLAGAIVVGTIDQVLLSTLQVRHAHLRSTALSRHLLVVDEVHASDAYMGRLLEAVLERHRAAGGHTLLMSATLGSHLAERLFGHRPTTEVRPPRPYPLVTVRRGEGPEELHPIEGVGRPKRVARELLPWLDDTSDEALARRAVEAARAGAKVLVLRNTVRGALSTQAALERIAPRELLFASEGRVSLHHARFARPDRELLDDAIERALGKGTDKNPRRPGGLVVVATQTVQQALDLDADLLLTDLCPMDVLLQRIGRLHRHDCPRPEGFERARVGVLVPPSRDLGELVGADGAARGPHGLGVIYDDLRVLEATWRELEAHPELHIPEMNRALVEATTHPAPLARIAASSPDLTRHEAYVIGNTLSMRRTAGYNLVDWEVPFGEAAFPSRELDRRISTRLGEGDRRVVFAEPVPGPFGLAIAELTVPSFLAHGLSEEAPVVEADEAGFTFTCGAARFRYDRLGLRPATPTHEENDDVGA